MEGALAPEDQTFCVAIVEGSPPIGDGGALEERPGDWVVPFVQCSGYRDPHLVLLHGG